VNSGGWGRDGKDIVNAEFWWGNLRGREHLERPRRR
jgi:hypothetical protein